MAVNDVEIRVGLQDNVTVPLKTLESSIIRFAGAVSAAFAIVQSVAFPIREAAEFEQAMLSVAKTTNFSEAAIAGLSKQLLDLSTTVDVTAVELANIAAIAGQLGLGEQGAEGIAAFTETTARFSSVLDVTVETAAEGLAKISNIFNISLNEAERISSAFNEVSNTSTASGQALLDIVRRLGNAGSTISLQQSLGLAATGVDFGLTLETIGTSFTKIISNMQSRAGQFAEFMGTSTETWASIVENDGVNALKLYLNKLNQVDSTTRAYTVRTLSGGGRIFALVNKLINDAANGYQILGKNINNAGGAFESGTSSIEEHQRVLTGTIAQLKILGNNITKLGTEIGQLSLPFLKELTKDLQEFFSDPDVKDGFTQFSKTIGEFGQSIVETIKYVAELNVNWANVANTFKIIIGYKLAKYLLSLTAALSGQIIKLVSLAASWTALGSTIKGTVVQSVGKASTTLASGLNGIGSGTRAAQARFVSSWDRTLNTLKQKNLEYDTYVRNVYQRTSSAIATTRVRMAAAGASELQIQAAVAGRYKAQAKAISGINKRRLRATKQLRKTVELHRAEATALKASQGPIAKASGLLGKLGATAKFLGGNLLRFVLGPWGLILTVLGSSFGIFGKLGDAITNLAGFLGFSTKAQQEEARAMRQTALAAQEEADKIRGLADAFRELEATKGALRFDSVTDIIATKGFEGIDQIPKNITDGVKNIEGALDAIDLGAESTRKEIERLNEEIQKGQVDYVNSAVSALSAEKRLEGLGTGRGGANRAVLRQELEETVKQEQVRRDLLEEQLKVLGKQREALIKKELDYRSAFDKSLKLAQKRGDSSAISDEITQRRQQLADAYNAIADGASDASIAAYDAAIAYRTTQEALQEATEAKEKFAETGIDETVKNSAEFVVELNRLESAVTQASDLAAERKKALADVVKAGEIGGKGQDTAFGVGIAINPETLEDAEKLGKILKDKGVGKQISENTKQTIKSLNQNVAWVKQTENWIHANERAADAAKKLKEDVSAAYKGIDKTIDNIRKPIRFLAQDIAELRRQRIIDEKLAKDTRKINDLFDSSLDRAVKLKQARADAFREAGNERKAASIEREIERETKQSERLKENALNTAKANSELERLIANREELIASASRLEALQSDAAEARANKNADEIKRVLKEMQKENELSEGLTKEMAEQAKRIEQDFRVTDALGNTSQPISDAIVDAAFKGVPEALDRIEESTNSVATNLDKGVGEAVEGIISYFDGLSTELTERTKLIDQAKEKLGLSTAELQKIKESYVPIASYYDELADKLNGAGLGQVLSAFQNISSIAKDTANIDLESTINDMYSVVEAMVLESTGKAVKSVNKNLQAIEVTADEVALKESVQAALDSFEPVVRVKGVVGELEVSKGTTISKAKGGLIEAPQALARGGAVFGAGTATSDSIPAWLSNGEYVIDAATTRFFGSNFFKTMQAIVRGGVGSSRLALNKLGQGFANGGYVGLPSYRMGLPAFAGGGLVEALDPTLDRLVSQLAIAQGAPQEVSERVELALAVGGGQYTVQGSRDQVKGLVEALKDVSRSIRRN